MAPNEGSGAQTGIGPDAEVLRAGLAAAIGQLGADLEEVDVQRAGRRHVVRVVVDRDGGVDLDLVAEISKVASELLDAPPLAAQLPGPFVLEVSSPGVDRPLTRPAQWRRSAGRLVKVQRVDGTELTARIVSSDDTTATLAEGEERRVVDYADVRRAVVQVEFERLSSDEANHGEEGQ